MISTQFMNIHVLIGWLHGGEKEAQRIRCLHYLIHLLQIHEIQG